jgi:hypothetical protein
MCWPTSLTPAALCLTPAALCQPPELTESPPPPPAPLAPGFPCARSYEFWAPLTNSRRILEFGHPLYVCVYYCRTYDKTVRGGGRRRVEDMCYERRQAEACVDESAHHALANAGGIGRLCERRRGSRRGVREGVCIGVATMLQPWTLRLTRNAAALAAASPTLLFRPL